MKNILAYKILAEKLREFFLSKNYIESSKYELDEKNQGIFHISSMCDGLTPEFKFESKGDINDLLKLEKELLDYFGFDNPMKVDYDDICDEYATPILEKEHKQKMWSEKGTIISMRYYNTSKSVIKIDIVLYGKETICLSLSNELKFCGKIELLRLSRAIDLSIRIKDKEWA